MKKFVFLAMAFLSACGGPNSGPKFSPPTTPITDDKPEPVGDSRCTKVQFKDQVYSYCVADHARQMAKRSTRDLNVVYYWHGLNGHPEEVIDSPGLAPLYSRLGESTPVTIGLSLGSQGVVASQASEIIETLIPRIESTFPREKIVHRLMVGASMGAYNALRVVAQKPEMFAAAAALCPALIGFNPYDSQEVQSYLARNRAYIDQPFFDVIMNVFKTRFPQKAEWDQNNPFNFLAQGKYDSVPLFLSVGRQDSLGFYEGVELFKQAAERRNPHQQLFFGWTQGGHCSFALDNFESFLRWKML